MSTHRAVAMVQAGHFFAQKLLLEQERRQACEEAVRAHAVAERLQAPEPVTARLAENVRLANEALVLACAAVEACVIDFTESARETLAAHTTLTAVPDATGAQIIEENTERRKA